MALVDADYRFIFTNVGNYGSNGDSGIFKNSTLGEAFAAKMLDYHHQRDFQGIQRRVYYPIALLQMRPSL